MLQLPSGNFPIVKFPKRQLPKGYVKTSELVPHAARGWGRALRLEQTLEVAAWGVSLRKLLLGKLPLMKSLWESTQHQKNSQKHFLSKEV